MHLNTVDMLLLCGLVGSWDGVGVDRGWVRWANALINDGLRSESGRLPSGMEHFHTFSIEGGRTSQMR